MALRFVSDLHITGVEDPLYRSLLQLLRDASATGDTVVLGGDIFDLWVGTQPLFRERYAEFVTALGVAARRSVEVHYIEGNHDFLLQDAFPAEARVRVHREELALQLHDRSFLLLHGDTLNQADVRYLALRAAFRSGPISTTMARVPGPWLERFGHWASGYSRGKKPHLPEDLPPRALAQLRQVYHSAASARVAQGYDFVVAGHCHDLDQAHLEVGGREGWYFNNGFPRVHGTYLVWKRGDAEFARVPLPS